jgi:hypothetical protein
VVRGLHHYIEVWARDNNTTPADGTADQLAPGGRACYFDADVLFSFSELGRPYYKTVAFMSRPLAGAGGVAAGRGGRFASRAAMDAAGRKKRHPHWPPSLAPPDKLDGTCAKGAPGALHARHRKSVTRCVMSGAATCCTDQRPSLLSKCRGPTR